MNPEGMALPRPRHGVWVLLLLGACVQAPPASPGMAGGETSVPEAPLVMEAPAPGAPHAPDAWDAPMRECMSNAHMTNQMQYLGAHEDSQRAKSACYQEWEWRMGPQAPVRLPYGPDADAGPPVPAPR
ncbi:hypothetical protein HNR76_000434 [Pseudoxanthomonas broegbernensis]|nr:hypothetical protein [Pseudoxanthomonas broegbernensis]